MTATSQCRIPDFLCSLAPASVLQIGAGPAVLVDPCLDDHAELVDVEQAITLQLPRQFSLVVLAQTAPFHDVARRRALLHTAIQHLLPAGHLAIRHHDAHALAPHEAGGAELTEIAQSEEGDAVWTLYRRGTRCTVHDLVFEARRTVRRVTASELFGQLQSTNPPTVLDTRTPSDRERFGVIAGSFHTPRTVLEWRVDPANTYLHPAITSFDQPLVVVCNHGYSSSLAAANLVRIGYAATSDLVGGVHAWSTAGLPLEPPDHTFLEL